jgi:hypothetical protein
MSQSERNILIALRSLLVVATDIAKRMDHRQDSGGYYAILNRALVATREWLRNYE